MTKLIIQIPCYNEGETLSLALAALPRDVPGVDHVEWLVIDDGSADDTLAVARQAGVDHVVRLPRHQGLARAFVAGLEASLRAGADIIVNTDADNQYCADDIPKLIEPILRGEAEAPSGFRAFSREAAMRMHVFNEYTYTIETIIQAGQKGMAIVSVPIRINEDLRPSRLMKSLPSYLSRQILTMVRIFVTYKPFRFFASAGVLVFIVGLLISVRFLYFYFTGNGAGHIQSLILSALLMGTGFFLAVVGLVVDLISVNRQLLEILDWRMQKIEERVSDDSAALTGPRTRDEAQ